MRSLLLQAAFIAGLGSYSTAQDIFDPSKSVRAVRTETPPILDGSLGDDVWKQADMITDFRQSKPRENAVPGEETEIRFLYDDYFLYVGIRCYVSDPSTILAVDKRRDGSMSSDDRIFIYFDTFRDFRNGYEFVFNPVGGRSDALLEGLHSVKEWDGIFESVAAIDEQGWVVEFALPFQTISFDPASDTWGFNATRVIRSANETIRWSAPLLNKAGRDLRVAGELTGLTGMNQGLGLDIVPYGLVRYSHDAPTDDDDLKGDFGGDLLWHITPQLTATLTAYTDFADTEVDNRRVNLTRFPLFFPEKRDFFLEDAGVFRFGGLGRDALPFHSRRIGIVDGEPVDILAGAKITGRAGDFELGFLDVQIDKFQMTDSKNLAVGRVAYHVQEESTVGAIVTHGDPASNRDNTLWGVDYNYRDSEFFGSQVLQGHAYFQQSQNAGDAHGAPAFGANISYPNDNVNWNASYREVDENFDPALGFVRRRGTRTYSGQYAMRYRTEEGSDFGVVRRLDWKLNGWYTTDRDDEIQTANANLNLLEVTTHDGDRLTLSTKYQKERLDMPFQIFSGVTIQPGDYTWHRESVNLMASGARPVSGHLNLRFGDYWSGERLSVSSRVSFRSTNDWTGSLNYSYADVDLPEGAFETHVGRASVNVFFSPDSSLAVLAQYDDVSEALTFNARFRWIRQPGNDLFIVFNESALADAGEYQTIATEAVVKVNWTSRF